MIWLQILGWILMLLPLAGILILSFIADWRGTLFSLAMVLIFAAEITGHWDYLGHMLDGAVIMFLYLKGKEK